MHRRELFKILGAGAVLPVFSPDLFAFLQQVQPGTGYSLRTLGPHQNDTVVAMMDQIIPATDTPGAKGARVNEFIDAILTEWATEEERQNFFDGLAGVDKQSNELFGKNFADASDAQQVALLRALDDSAMSERSYGSAVPWERDGQLKGNFYDIFKGITLHGYYTSEIGFSEELKLQIIPGALHGCSPVPFEKKA